MAALISEVELLEIAYDMAASMPIDDAFDPADPAPDPAGVAVHAEELRRIRAEFITGSGADDRGESSAMFLERDRTLADNRAGRSAVRATSTFGPVSSLFD